MLPRLHPDLPLAVAWQADAAQQSWAVVLCRETTFPGPDYRCAWRIATGRPRWWSSCASERSWRWRPPSGASFLNLRGSRPSLCSARGLPWCRMTSEWWLPAQRRPPSLCQTPAGERLRHMPQQHGSPGIYGHREMTLPAQQLPLSPVTLTSTEGSIMP